MFFRKIAIVDKRNPKWRILHEQGVFTISPIKIDSSKEYGHDVLEVKEGKGDIVIVDDVLATGGTILAAEELLRLAGYNVIGAVTLIDLTYLHGDIKVGGKNVLSLIKY